MALEYKRIEIYKTPAGVIIENESHTRGVRINDFEIMSKIAIEFLKEEGQSEK